MGRANLGLGLSVSHVGIFRALADLQRVMEAWFHVRPLQAANANQICPIGGARWQGEWLVETDFLVDFHAELDSSIIARSAVKNPEVHKVEMRNVPSHPVEVHLASPLASASTLHQSERHEAWVCVLFAGL